MEGRITSCHTVYRKHDAKLQTQNAQPRYIQMAALMSAAQVKPSWFSANNLFRGPKTGRVSAVRAERSGVNQLTVASIRQHKPSMQGSNTALQCHQTDTCTIVHPRDLCYHRHVGCISCGQHKTLFYSTSIFPLFHNFATPGNFRAKQ